MMSVPLIIQIGVGLFAANYIAKSTQPQKSEGVRRPSCKKCKTTEVNVTDTVEPVEQKVLDIVEPVEQKVLDIVGRPAVRQKNFGSFDKLLGKSKDGPAFGSWSPGDMWVDDSVDSTGASCTVQQDGSSICELDDGTFYRLPKP